jgi:hypothetical protein
VDFVEPQEAAGVDFVDPPFLAVQIGLATSIRHARQDRLAVGLGVVGNKSAASRRTSPSSDPVAACSSAYNSG